MCPIRNQTLRENVLTGIRDKIIRRELAPGERIIEQNLSDEFGVSRGPIREALRQLEQEGLIEYIRNAGCSVKTITMADLYEIYLLRTSYEIMAIRLCEGQFSPEELEEMEAILEEMRTTEDKNLNQLVEQDHRLHRLIIRKGGLKRLEKSWEELNYGSTIASVNSARYRERIAQEQHQLHRALVESCRSCNKTVISRAIYDHYMTPVRRLIQESGLDVNNFHFVELYP